MPSQKVIKVEIDPTGSVAKGTAGTAELSEKVFGEAVKPKYFWEVVRQIRASRRAGTSATKNRALITGGGRKPWRQKGTGRARAGSRRSPLWRGGAVVFGPHPRDWSYRVNKKFKRKALRSAISARHKEGRVIVVEKFDLPEIKTRLMKNALDELGVGNALIVDDRPGMTLARSVRNIPKVKLADAHGMNVYDVLLHEYLIFTRAGLEAVQGVLEK